MGTRETDPKDTKSKMGKKSHSHFKVWRKPLASSWKRTLGREVEEDGWTSLSIPQLLQHLPLKSGKSWFLTKPEFKKQERKEKFHPLGYFLQQDHSLAARQERSVRRVKVFHRTCSAAVLWSRLAPHVSSTEVLNLCLAACPGRMLRRQAVLSTVHE